MTTMLRILVALALLAGVLWAGVSAVGGQASEVRAVAVLTGEEMARVTGGEPTGEGCFDLQGRACNGITFKCESSECWSVVPPDGPGYMACDLAQTLQQWEQNAARYVTSTPGNLYTSVS